MSADEDYRQNAAKCLSLAWRSKNEAVRLGLVDMAHAWLRLAEQAEKNDQTDIVYETPARRQDVAVP